MGQTFSNLTNQGVYDPASNQTQFGPPQEIPKFLSVAAAKRAAPDSATLPDSFDSSDIGFQPHPGASPQTVKPSFLQAVNQTNPQTGLPVSPLQNRALSKGGKLLEILGSGVQGALAGQAASEQAVIQSHGMRSGGAGTGFESAYTLPFLRARQQQEVAQGQAQTQIAQQQSKFFPQIQQLSIQKTQSEIGKNQAEGAKAGAEASGQDYLNALHEAQTSAARYKEVGGALYDVSGQTPQPVQGAGQFVPADAQMAKIANVPVGTQLPIATAKTLKSMANEGIHPVQAGGRSKLVDNTGKTVADLGAANSVVSFNMQNSGATGQGGQPSAIAQAIASGEMKWQDAVSARTPMSVKQAILKEVKGINPNFNSGDFDVEKKVKEAFTSGPQGQQLTAIGTARNHMATFKQTADELKNGDFLAANRVGNWLNTQFGSDKATNFDLARTAFAGEVGKAFAGANVGVQDRAEILDKINHSSSWDQLKGYADTADELLAGKQKSLKESYDQGVQAKPNFGQQGGAPPAGATHAVIVDGKVVGYTSDGKTMTPVQ